MDRAYIVYYPDLAVPGAKEAIEALTEVALKEGVEKVIEELKGQLRERKAVKVKLLQSSRGEKSTEELASILAERSGAKMYETIGNTAIFVR